jgi:hypothetical protein
MGMHLHQPIERVAGAMLQRHLDAHLPIPSHAFIARSARRAWAYWSHLNGECVPTGSRNFTTRVENQHGSVIDSQI